MGAVDRKPAPTFADFSSLRYAKGGPAPTQRIFQPVAAVLAYGAMRLRLSPTSVTLAALLCSLSASIWFAAGASGLATMLASLLLYEFAFALDCADGQLARATQRASEFGAWLDVTCDHIRNVAIATALGLRFAHDSPLSPTLAALGVAVALAGMTVSLHTSTQLRRLKAAESHRSGLLAMLVSSALDTPVFLLLICVLRDSVALLWLYAAGMGAAYLALSIGISWLRLAKAR
jgi:phosphatidylglycerophosphate synthase